MSNSFLVAKVETSYLWYFASNDGRNWWWIFVPFFINCSFWILPSGCQRCIFKGVYLKVYICISNTLVVMKEGIEIFKHWKFSSHTTVLTHSTPSHSQFNHPNEVMHVLMTRKVMNMKKNLIPAIHLRRKLLQTH